MIAYGFAIFTGAFLLFQVQPLIGKYVLPWFGGGPGIWTTCMLFFQLLLLGGYAYAHLSSRWLKLRTQVVVHLALIGLAILTLPITPSDSWKPDSPDNPSFRIIALLTVSLGLPYFVLSGTAPLLQHWFSRTYPGRSPFRLYALSNAGSLLALLSYPTVIESWLARTAQADVWGATLGLYGLGCFWCGTLVWKSHALQSQGPVTEGEVPRPAGWHKLLWVLLPACASVLLLAVTNKICQDVAVIAFLWILPLTVYLLSFIICFDRPQWYQRTWFGPALAVSLAVFCWAMRGGFGLSVPLQIMVYMVGLFVCCMVCHGEVYRLRPHPAYLTSFYLMISAGGALGGIFVALVAPVIFTDYFELHWSLVVCGALFLAVCMAERKSAPRSVTAGVTLGAGAVGLLILAALLWGEAHRFSASRVARNRNFYGVLNVYRHQQAGMVEIVHGRIAHGMQYTAPERANYPTLYFNPESGVGRTIVSLDPAPRRIAVVGLGAGTLAAYARPGDWIRFYEINPEVERLARAYFTYLPNCAGELTVALGDARLSMEREPPQNLDLLVLDAFSSDSIPIHLLTLEAFKSYNRHLKPNGVIAVHVSNMSLNLEPVVIRLAQQFGFLTAVIHQRKTDTEKGVLPSIWVILTRAREILDRPQIRTAMRPPDLAAFEGQMWTDDFSALFPILRWEEFFRISRPGESYVESTAVFAKSGDLGPLIQSLRNTVSADPESANALNNLAVLLATAPDAAHRNGSEAVALAEKACQITQRTNTAMLSTLAAAYAEAGRFEDAVTTAENASALAEQKGEKVLHDRIRQLLEYYRNRKPYHQSAK